MTEGEVRKKFLYIFEVPSVAKPCLDKIVKPIEQELVVQLGGDELTLSELADRWKPEESLRQLMDRAVYRGILEKEEKNGAAVYKSTDFYTRLDYFAKYEDYLSLPRRERAELDKWYLDSYTERIVPYMEDFRKDDSSPDYTTHTPVPLEQIKDIVDEAETVAVVPCDCRRLHEDWDNPTSYCMNLDEAAEDVLDRGHGEELSNSDAKDLLDWTDDQGLMHCTDQSDKSEDPRTICNCDIRWCYPFRAAEKLESEGYWPVRQYIASRDKDKCIECGLCAQRCQFNAFKENSDEEDSGDKIEFEPDSCWGCGICATACPVSAIEIIPRETT